MNGRRRAGADLATLFAGVPADRAAPFFAIEAEPLRQADARPHPVRYLDLGPRGAPVVVLLPGLLGDARALFQQAAALTNDVRVLSPEYVASPRLADQVAALAAMLDAAEVARAVLVGQTLGGYLAQYFTRAHGERVAGLVLVHADLPQRRHLAVSERTVRRMRWRPWFLIRRFLHGRLTQMVDAWAAGPGKDAEQAALVRAYFAHRFANLLDKRQALDRYRLLADVFRQADLVPGDFAGWPGRVLVIYSDDNVFSQDLAQLEEVFPGLTKQQLGSDHNVSLLLEPATTTALIREFLTHVEMEVER
jgi:pimeloyl-ACP methyl ester carboxylesterase